MFKVFRFLPLIGARLLVSLFLFVLDESVSAQSSSKRTTERLELLPGAGSLFHTEVRGEEVTWVVGNVHFRQGEGDFRADSARWHQKANRVVLVGKVKIRYPDYQLSADSVRYDAKTKEGWAYGQIRYEDLKEKTVLRGERGRYEREKKYLLIDQKPEMQLLPSASGTVKPETTFVWAKKLEFFGDEEKGVGTDSVRIRRGGVFANAQKAVFLRKEEKLVLTEKPRGGDDKSEVSGERLTLFFKESRVQRLLAEKKARAVYRDLTDTSRADTTRSELAADSVIFHFADETPNLISALGKAYIYYNQADGKIKNHASGDSVHLHLKDRRVENVSIHGGGQGTYYAFPEGKPGGDTVYYQAEEIEYQIPPNKIFLLSRAEARYQNLTLEADSMLYDGKAELLYASGFADSSRNRTKRVLKDGKDEVAYDRLAYDFSTKKGKMKSSRTQLTEGYYRGADVSRVSEEEVFIRNGWFTTCDAEHPHYYFSSAHMKLIHRNRMIAKPVVLRIADVPLAAIPFYIFPLKPGRHSGILNLRIGNFGNDQRGIHNIGYYFALSDYYDLTTAVDVDETGGDLTLLFRSGINYAWRYRFNGSLSGSYRRDRSVLSIDSSSNLVKRRGDQWDFRFNHYQTLSPTATLSGSGNFVSDKSYYPDRSLDLSTRLNRVLNPQVNFSKNLGWGGISIVAQKTFNLDTDERTSVFPSFSLTKPAKPFFPPGRGKSPAWYNSIYYSYSAGGSNYFNRIQKIVPIDSVTSDTLTEDRKRATLNHNFAFSAPQKIFWLTLSPNFNYTENWFHINRTDGSEAAGVSSGTFRRGSGSVGVSSTTNLYGTFLFRLGSLTGLRHVLSPSVSYSWIPKSTRHKTEAAFVGVGVSTQTAQVLNFSLSQYFQAKFQSEKGEKKIDLFTATMAASYNAEANFRRWSELTTAVRTSAVPNFSFDFSARHDFYDTLGNGLDRPRLLNFSITSAYNFNRTFSFGPPVASANGSLTGLGGEDQLPFNFSISHTITQIKQPRPVVTTQQVNLNASLKLTKSWQVSYAQSYDLSSKASSFQEVVLNKDLHCWQGYFSWRPSGFRKGYYFILSVKALPELKISKEPVGLGTFLPGTFR